MDQGIPENLISSILLALLLMSHVSSKTHEKVFTQSGPIMGINVPVRSKNVLQFRNIPYAKPPVGDLRFRKPVPVDPWTDTLDATEFGPLCVQSLDFLPALKELAPNVNLSEDCLSLNVYVPEELSLEKKKSVMVWIHGGGFSFGSGTGYDGSYLVLGGDVIVVTINYRLGVFGFLSTSDSASPGNYGLWDQIMAFKWVKNNIAAFGGDPDSITIFGESAGAISVSLQMLVPGNRGLFHRAIGQSGAASGFLTFSVEPLNAAKDLGRKLKCIDGKDIGVNTFALLDCLRKLPMEDVLKAQTEQVYTPVKAKDYTMPLLFWPVIDGDLYNGNPINALKDEDSFVHSFYQSVDYITGTTNQEGSLAAGMLAMYQQELSFNISDGIPTSVLCDVVAPAFGKDVFHDKTIAGRLLCDFYKRDDPEEQGREIANLYGDVLFYSSAIEDLDYHSMNNKKTKTFQYLFSKATNTVFFLALPQWLNDQAPHGEEIIFLFGPDIISKKYDVFETESSAHLSQQMIKYWTNFAKNGDPNGSGLPQWPQYKPDDRNYIDLNDDIRQQSDLFLDRMKLHLDTIPATIEQQTKVISTPSGSLKGIYITNGSETVLQFRNIPYAKAPVGDLRFRKPIAFGKWENTLDATAFGPSCIQQPHLLTKYLPFNGTSEDCLSLNIYVPHTVDLNKKRSVMVWIHGGGFIFGQGSLHDCSWLASEGDVIVVTINYRLGILGFLSTGDSASPGNYGLWDQILALKWVKTNIEAFGGDPDSITIFGQSAGSFSVTLLMLIPENKGLFHRAIGQSGSALSFLTYSRNPLKVAEDFGTKINCTTYNNGSVLNTFALVDCLRKRSSDDIYEVQGVITQNMWTAKEFWFKDPLFWPVIDSELFKNRNPALLLTNSDSDVYLFFHSIDLIAGATDLEGNVMGFQLKAFQDEYEFNVTEGIPKSFLLDVLAPTIGEMLYNDKNIAAKALYDLYKRDDNFEQGRQICNMIGDAIFVVPAIQLLDLHSISNIESSTYQYIFSREITFTLGAPKWSTGKAGHGNDIFFLFGPDVLMNVHNPFVNDEAKLFSTQMIKYWTNFAKKGDPNGEELPTWPAYNIKERSYLDLGFKVASKTNVFSDRTTLLIETIPAMIEKSTVILSSPSGPMKGIKIPVKSQTVLQFRNIPYAKPPLKNLRFKKPVPYGKWTKTLDATVFGKSCMQNSSSINFMKNYTGKMKTSEDCLTLNVYVPGSVSTDKQKSVMVWIHGGGYLAGQGTIYDGSLLALEGDVIVVTINYRLGAFGFLSTGDSSAPGNYGLWDQRMAFRWVKDNIKAFGGNTESITIFGNSVGSFSVTYHMMVPENKELFHRVIAESGSATLDVNTYKDPFDLTKRFGKDVGCIENIEDDISSVDLVECLRKVNADTIIEIQNKCAYRLSNELIFKPVFLPNVQDREFFKHGNPLTLLSDSESLVSSFYKSVDFLGGTNSLDGALALRSVLGFQQSADLNFNPSDGIPTSFVCDMFIPSMVNAYFSQQNTVVEKSLCDFYSRQDMKDQGKRLLDLYGDIVFFAPKLRALNLHSNDLSNTYQYLFSHGSGIKFLVPIYDWTSGAVHSEEIFYLFGPAVLPHLINVRNSTDTEQLSNAMLKYWTNFAKTGDPNAETLPPWPRYDKKSQQYLNLDLEIRQERQLFKDRMTFILETIPEFVRKANQNKDRSEL